MYQTCLSELVSLFGLERCTIYALRSGWWKMILRKIDYQSLITLPKFYSVGNFVHISK